MQIDTAEMNEVKSWGMYKIQTGSNP
jgi:hypothetical protein